MEREGKPVRGISSDASYKQIIKGEESRVLSCVGSGERFRGFSRMMLTCWSAEEGKAKNPKKEGPGGRYSRDPRNQIRETRDETGQRKKRELTRIKAIRNHKDNIHRGNVVMKLCIGLQIVVLVVQDNTKQRVDSQKDDTKADKGASNRPKAEVADSTFVSDQFVKLPRSSLKRK